MSADAPWDARFAPLLRGVLRYLPDDEPLLAHTDLASAGLDSMASVELLLNIESAYDIALPDELLTAETFATPESLWKAVSAHLPSGDGEVTP